MTALLFPVFFVGDRVRRIEGSYPWEGMIEGRVYTVSQVQKDGTMKVAGNTHWYHSRHFVKVKERVDEE